MGNLEGLVTLVFFKIESKNLVCWGILMQFFSKSCIFPNSKLLWGQYDVIISIFQDLITLSFLKVEAQSLVDLTFYDVRKHLLLL